MTQTLEDQARKALCASVNLRGNPNTLGAARHACGDCETIHDIAAKFRGDPPLPAGRNR